MMKSLIAFAAALLLAAPCAWSQTSMGQVSGTVRDTSGAVIPGTPVVLVNTATNITSRTTTNQVGFYIFPGVVPGKYILSVEMAGMQKFEGSLAVEVRQSVVIDPVMQPAGTQTVVEVKDITPLVTTDNPTVGSTLTRSFVEQLPINGRSISTLLATQPGVEGQRTYGTRQGSAEYVWDGAQEVDRRWGNAPTVGLDAVEEFRVEVNAVSAKFSRPTSVVISTKSGTNQIHGSAFETARNSAIGVARRRQDTWPKAPFLNRHEFGASVGGPVYIPKLYNGKDRTFWFTAYEGSRQAQSPTAQYRVPTMAMRQGDFSELKDAQGRLSTLYDPWSTTDTWSRQPFAYGGKLNAIDPARQSPTTKYLFDITRVPTNANNPLIDWNWTGMVPTSSRSYTFTNRLDHRFSDNDNFFVRATVSDSNSLGNCGTNCGGGQVMLNNVYGRETNTTTNMSISSTWIHTVSPTMFNELLVSAKRQNWYGGNNNPDKTNFMEMLGVPNPFGVTTEAAPQFTSTGIGSGSNAYDFRENTWKRGIFNNFVVDDNATKIFGKHELQFGGHFRYDQLNILPDQTWVEGYHYFDTAATTLYDPTSTPQSPQGTPLTGHNLGNMFIGSARYQNFLNRKFFYWRGGEYAAYFQDNWKATPRLTLNFGLRWEYWPFYKEKNGMLSGFNKQTRALVLGAPIEDFYATGNSHPGIINRLRQLDMKFESYQEAGQPSNFAKASKRDFGPRAGFAYRALDGRKSFVIRGGYSLAYFPVPLFTFVDRMFTNYPTMATFNLNLNDSAQSPDGIPNYLLRTAPPIIMGVNSKNAINLDIAQGINRGSPTISYFGEEQPDSRVHSWNLTVEKDVAANVVARVRYLGNRTANLEQYYEYNGATPDYIWYMTTGEPIPTGPYSGVARRAFDQALWGDIREYTKTGWSNFNGMEFEVERRYSKGIGFQLSYVVGNTLATGATWSAGVIPATNQFMPGTVPTDFNELNRFLNYQRDTEIPKHRVRWNWIVDVPVGKNKLIAGNAGGILDKFIGGWQIAGMGNVRTNYFSLPTSNWNLTGEKIEIYGYKYPIQNCTGRVSNPNAACIPGYLWYNGYIPANQINSPTGYMGIPDNYKPAVTPLIPWGSTELPANAPTGTNVSQYWDTNNVWIRLNNGNAQRITYNTGLHPWRNQYFPGVRQWGLDASLFKNVQLKERVNIRVNADFFNVLNMQGIPTNISTGNGFLDIRNSGYAARVMQLGARITW
jgi:hypothetical protein